MTTTECPLIGTAKTVAENIIEEPGLSPKCLFYGPPGVGKTEAANWIAAQLAGKWDIESINGRNCTIHVLNSWESDLHCSSMFGAWRVKIINEVDTLPRDAQDALLSILDELPAQRAILCTSNLNLEQLSERFRTRFVRFKFEAPSPDEIKNLLNDKGLPDSVATTMAECCCGNVRQACLDADNWLRAEKVKAKKPKISQDLLDLFATDVT